MRVERPRNMFYKMKKFVSQVQGKIRSPKFLVYSPIFVQKELTIPFLQIQRLYSSSEFGLESYLLNVENYVLVTTLIKQMRTKNDLNIDQNELK